MTLVIITLYRHDGFVHREGTPVAELIFQNGLVQFRTEDFALWNDVARSQEFYVGDRIATGGRSGAKIRFKTGAIIDLEEDTQIVIRAETESGSDGYLVSLIKGSAEAQGRLTVDATPRKFTLTGKSDVLALNKPLNGEPSIFKLIRNGQIISNVPRPTGEKQSSRSFEFSPAFMGSLNGEAGSLQMNDHSVYWTSQSIETEQGQFPVSVKVGTSKNSNLIPFIEVSEPAGVGLASMRTRRQVIDLQPSSGVRDVNVTMDRIKSYAKKSTINGIRVWTVEIGFGMRKRNEPVSSAFSTQKIPVKLASLKDLGPGSVTLHLGSMDPQPGRKTWIEQKSSLTESTASWSVELGSTTELWRLVPLIQSAERFGISREKLVEKDLRKVARDQQMIASVSAKTLPDRAFSSIRKLLEGDVVYQGDSSALVALEEVNSVGLKRLAANKQELGKEKIFFVTRDASMVPINRSFLGVGPVAEFIASNGKAYFDRPVKIVDVRN